MKVNILLFSQLKEAAGKDRLSLEVEKGTPVQAVVERLMADFRFSQCRDLPFVYAINENFASKDDILQESDTLAVMTPVSGGAI
jgi:molybdopterin synthase sulfur carrier subunit